MRLHFFSFLISLLLTSAALAAGHGNDGYPNIRMFLQESGSETGQYRAVCFENATDVGNFYGSTNGNYTLAQEFFASPVPPRTQYCATRFPGILQARAHLWSANVYNSLAEDYKTYADVTILERLLKIPGLEGIVPTSRMTGTNVLMIQLTSDVIQLIDGIQPMMVEWEGRGGFELNFMIFCILLPRIRADFLNQCGIAHYS